MTKNGIDRRHVRSIAGQMDSPCGRRLVLVNAMPMQVL